MSTKQKRIAGLAKKSPAIAFTSLNHYLDEEWMRYAYERTRKDAAVGVDGQTAQEYAADLQQTCSRTYAACWSGSNRAVIGRRQYDELI